jgi:hypothetical protein
MTGNLNRHIIFPTIIYILLVGKIRLFVEFIFKVERIKLFLQHSYKVYHTMKRQLFILWATALLTCACTKNEEKPNPEPIPPHGKEVTVAIACGDAGADTRTSIDPGDWATTRWDGDDQISLWATDGTNWPLNATTFSLAYFSPEWSKALFTATIASMNEGDYEFYGVYPVPATTNGTQVHYTLPALQSGEYDGKHDIMAADVLQAGELPIYATSDETMDASPTHSFAFRHKCHILRIEVPDGRDRWGEPIQRMVIDFPTDVVGDVSFDAKTPAAPMQLTNGSSTVTINFAEPFRGNEQRYLWVFINPCQINGNISFTTYTEEGYQSQTLSVPVDKAMEAGKITPITLTLPDELPVSYLDFRIETNNLGENPNSITIQAPAGLVFRDGGTSKTFPFNAQNIYTLSYYTSFYGSQATAADFQLTFDSEHAIVYSSLRVPASAATAGRTTVNMTIPWLFSENFDGADNFDNRWDAWNAADYAATWCTGRMSGWSGARARVTQNGAGVGIGLTTARYRGNLISAPMSNLKSNCKIRVTFRGARQCEDNNYQNVGVYMGSTTTTGAPYGDDGIFNTKTKIPVDYVSGASFNNIPNKDYTFDINSAGPTTRVFWRTDDGTTNWIWYHYEHFFLDDVRISITQ